MLFNHAYTKEGRLATHRTEIRGEICGDMSKVSQIGDQRSSYH